MSAVDQIKANWSLDAMANQLGLHIPERGKFCSPFRADENPSCERFGETIKDRSTGETFDVIDIYAEVKGLSNADAIKELRETVPSIASKPKPKPEPFKLVIPPLHYSVAEAEQVAKIRRLSLPGVDFAGFFGTIGFGIVAGFDCWILSDGDGKLAEARRMDGEKFPAVGSLGERKSHTLRGSRKSWPLGMNPPGIKVPEKLPVWLVEGGPDYLAACDVLVHSKKEFLPVAMMGAGQSIHADALPFFRGRHVRILGHPGEAGLKAAKTWRRQLMAAGATVRAQQLDGYDLNELVTLHGAEAVAKDLNDEHARH